MKDRQVGPDRRSRRFRCRGTMRWRGCPRPWRRRCTGRSRKDRDRADVLVQRIGPTTIPVLALASDFHKPPAAEPAKRRLGWPVDRQTSDSSGEVAGAGILPFRIGRLWIGGASPKLFQLARRGVAEGKAKRWMATSWRIFGCGSFLHGGDGKRARYRRRASALRKLKLAPRDCSS